MSEEKVLFDVLMFVRDLTDVELELHNEYSLAKYRIEIENHPKGPVPTVHLELQVKVNEDASQFQIVLPEKRNETIYTDDTTVCASYLEPMYKVLIAFHDEIREKIAKGTLPHPKECTKCEGLCEGVSRMQKDPFDAAFKGSFAVPVEEFSAVH